MTLFQAATRSDGKDVLTQRMRWERSYTALALVVLLLITDVVLSNGTFSEVQALGIANAALPLALAAVGETFVILTNGIDLSVGSIVTLGSVTVATLGQHGQAPEGIVLAIAVGGVAGFANGIIVHRARIAPLIATLATSSIYFGVALLIMPIPGGRVPSWLSTWAAGTFGSIPVAVVWLVLLIVVGWLLLHRTKFGVTIRALGGSEASSWAAGIRVGRVRILAYLASGISSSLAGVVLGGLTQSGDPTIGVVYLLEAIAALVIGGTSLSGGGGTLVGSVLGALVLSLVSAVLLMSGVTTNFQYVVTGVIVIGALLAYSLQSKWSQNR